ncbi:hypothetical protein MKW94_003284 [Papaver nudicaule]|uniref:EF-hand domain-containing protein n=1 Tax=Papaver nudicaule TaxID=74823 RepID=A0AA42AWS8_PAPNU|nr:hypothetical protein [Papaver nudicaule]
MSAGKKVDETDLLEDIENIFNRFDVNGDGKISSAELADVYKELGDEMTPEVLKKMMDDIDTDGDGYINLKEFIEFHRGTDGTIAFEDREIRFAFGMYDTDKNGLISPEELQNGLGYSADDCSKIISALDTDGDGNINFEEFKKMMLKDIE